MDDDVIDKGEFDGFHIEYFPDVGGVPYEDAVARVGVGVKAVWLLYKRGEEGYLRFLGVNPRELTRFCYGWNLTRGQVRMLGQVPSVAQAADALVATYKQHYDEQDRQQVWTELLAFVLEQRESQ